MPFSNEDMGYLKEVFVTRQECNDTTKVIREEVATNHEDSAVINAKLNIVLWLLSGIGLAIIGMLVRMIFHV